MRNVIFRWLCCAFAVATVALAGCDTAKTPEKPAKPQKPVVGVFVYKGEDVYVSIVRKALQSALADKADVVLFDATNDQWVQNEQLDKALAGKMDALAVNLVDPTSAPLLVDKIKKKGIPVVFFNREPELTLLKNYTKSCFVGTDPNEAGVLQGELIKRLWDKNPGYDRNKDGGFQYIMIQATVDNPEAIARTEYSVRRARDLGLTMHQVGGTLLCDWDRKTAYEAMRAALPTLKDSVELVIANSDAMALGAVEALQEIGYNTGDPTRFIPVVGVDALDQAVEAIRKGTMSATVKQDGDLMGNVVASFLLNAARGKDFLEGTGRSWDSSGVAIRLPYASFGGE